MDKRGTILILGEASGYLPYTVYMATDKFISENPAVVQKFTTAVYKGQLWVKDHTAAEIAEVILPQFPDSDIDSLTKIVERYKAQNTWKETPVFDQDGFLLIQEIMEQGGELSAPVAFDSFVNNSFAQKALDEIK